MPCFSFPSLPPPFPPAFTPFKLETFKASVFFLSFLHRDFAKRGTKRMAAEFNLLLIIFRNSGLDIG